MEIFSQIHQISNVEKIQKLPFFNDKFHWLTKYIDFFFGNFHIWNIAWSRLWLHHKIDNENTVNLVSFVDSMHSPYFI
jgi:hypothetical protein